MRRAFGVSVDELLDDGSEPVTKLAAENPDTDKMLLRVRVRSTDGDKVDVNLPVKLIEIAVSNEALWSKLGGGGDKGGNWAEVAGFQPDSHADFPRRYGKTRGSAKRGRRSSGSVGGMKIRIRSNGRKFVFFLPLSTLLVKLVLKAAIRTDRDGQKREISFTAEEKRSIVATGAEMAKALKKYRRRYGKFPLVRLYSADDGDEVFISV